MSKFLRKFHVLMGKKGSVICPFFSANIGYGAIFSRNYAKSGCI